MSTVLLVSRVITVKKEEGCVLVTRWMGGGEGVSGMYIFTCIYGGRMSGGKGTEGKCGSVVTKKVYPDSNTSQCILH
jgi:hypothetical protein